MYEAYARLPIGDANAASTNVVWTSLIAFLFLGEKIHWLDLCAIPLNIIGVVLLAQGRGCSFSLIFSSSKSIR